MTLLQTRLDRPNGSRMNHTWYVTFEVPKIGTLVRRRSPRLTKTFRTEIEAREFARAKFDNGLIVTAGTINPHLPRRAIASADIPDWLKPGQEPGSPDQAGAHPTRRRLLTLLRSTIGPGSTSAAMAAGDEPTIAGA